MKTYQPKAKEVKRNWHLVDLKDQVLGRVATQIATYLIGKHKATYSAHMDSGDYVIAINASKVRVTGNKENQKVYQSHSGYPGGFKEVKYAKYKAENPGKIIELAVKRMLPKNRLAQDRMKRFKIFTEDTHPYEDKFKSHSQSERSYSKVKTTD